MGSGKTTIGRQTAQRLSRPFHDTDERIVIGAGRSVADIFATDGEQAFRDLETAALHEALLCHSQSVISTGGGLVMRDVNRAMLREHATVVWLRATPATLAARVSGRTDRPLLNGVDPLERLTSRR